MATAELPKYEQVKRSLIKEIELGKWSIGGAIPSEAQLLQRFNVSRPTLIRSLQDMVREGYLYRRQGKGTFVAEWSAKETPANGAAPSVPVFTARSTDALAGGPGEVLLRLLRGAQSVLGTAHVDMALRYASLGAVDDETLKFLDKTEPAAALVIEPSFSPHLCAELVRREWSVWSVNEPLRDGNCVYIDQERAGYLAVQYLVEKKNRRRIALINGPADAYWGFAAKRRGYLRALADAGIEPDERLIREGSHLVDTEAGRSMMLELLSARPGVDGVVGASDLKAIGARAAAQEAGLRVPDDLAIIGIDDTLAGSVVPPLPAVALPFEEVGRRAAEEALRGNMMTSRHACAEIQLKPTVVER